jgi:hypothetical protein
MSEIEKREGWGLPGMYSRKWHYFKNGISLCRRFRDILLQNEELETGNDDSKDNCATCKRKLQKMREKNV